MTEWLKTAVFYEIYPQSFKDSDGDGIGDLNGIIEKLDYIKDLGCNAIWMNPCYDSPFQDAGYDVRDYKKIAARYGTLEDMKRLFEKVHDRGMHILLDLVPGHTSEEHPWFVESSKKEANEYSDRYIWTDSWFQRAEGLAYIAGERERNGAYVTNFFKCQPALNYGFFRPEEEWQKPMDHPACLATRDAITDVMLYWLEMGCDGFRVDMADSLVKKDDAVKSGTCAVWSDMLSKVLDKYPDAVFVSEWNQPEASIGRAGFQMDFYLDWTGNGYHLLMRDYDDTGRDNSFFKKDSDRSIQDFLREYLPRYEAVKDKGMYCLITGNHDMIRAAHNLDESERKLAYAFLLTMPGAPFIYYGDEIGMRYLDIPYKEGGYTRTGSRTPMQWNNSCNFGFSEADASRLYLPMDDCDGAPTVETQQRREDSLYNTVRRLLDIRQKQAAFARHDNLEILIAEEKKRSFAYRRDDLTILCNPSGHEEEVEAEVSGQDVIFVIGSLKQQDDGCVLGAQSFVICQN
ncbi:MAG: alpha-amylase family glycosyl hydrolase [Eubacterium sp.]|nr:alpha-amylase family glycosyl hydrolase [Eubacterium sp.]